MHKKNYFIGVDGGATKTIVRLENSRGELLGRVTAPPANIRISVANAWQSIQSAIQSILSAAKIVERYNLHVGMGLAGIEIKKAYDEFLSYPHHFTTLILNSDAHIACVGAHKKDGAIIIVGTGVIGYQIMNETITRVSGYGFPHDDEGGGAWLGFQAIQLTLKAHDQRIVSSSLTQKIIEYFHNNFNDLVAFANTANSTQYATLAPIVIALAEQGNEDAINLLKLAAKKITDVFYALRKQSHNTLPCALVGGISTYLKLYLENDIQNQLVEINATPDQGAIKYLKQTMGLTTCQ